MAYRSRRAVVYWSREIGDEEECFEVLMAVGPAEPRGSPYAGSREVELIEVRDNYGLRPDITEAIPEVDLERLYGEAIDDVADRDEAAREDAMEQRAEMARERWDY